MIGYLEGTLLKIGEDRILLLSNQVGYEIILPAFVMESVRVKNTGEPLSLYIYYQQTERQPKPVLIGFNLEAEKEFFQLFVTVEDIGPLKAVKAMTIPVRDIARAIENRDEARLRQLKGIGGRTAQKIIATLSGKMDKFALIRKTEKIISPAEVDITKPVIDVLVSQLGHRNTDARKMIASAMDRNPNLRTPEELFDEVYRGEKEK
jgi:Holliday junction DNA helicase RuvA